MASSPPLASRTNSRLSGDKADDAAEAARAALTPGATGEGGDAALARLMMEQERAFFLAAGGDFAALHEYGSPDAAAFGGENLHRAVAAAQLHMGVPHADGGGPAGGEALTEDEALARQLQEEEAREWSGRMLAMAGVVPAAHGDAPMLEGEDDDGEEDEEGDIGLDVDAMSYEELLALGDAAGHVSRGVSAAVVARLPTRTYATEAQAAAAAAAPAMCLICRQEYVTGDSVMDLPCAHNFHADCITPWLTTVNKACPCCKREVTPRKVERMAERDVLSPGAMRS